MKLAFIGSLLSSMYADKLTVKRFTKVTNPDGTIGMSKAQTEVYIDKNCRISFESEDNSLANKEDTNPKNIQVKIFCDNTLDINKGDTLIVKRMAEDGITVLATYKGLAGLPSKFVSHQEILMSEVGDA